MSESERRAQLDAIDQPSILNRFLRVTIFICVIGFVILHQQIAMLTFCNAG